MAVATFGAGCFWGVEDTFSKIEGVLNTYVGYQGGQTENPTYEDVCNKNTGHAEVVQVVFDDNLVTYGELLNTFWNCHNPTTLNRQGVDVGNQYRSVIFTNNDHQNELAHLSKQNLDKSGRFQDPIVTEILPSEKFYKAEEYHQNYFKKNKQASCSI